MSETAKRENRLIHETSPYLLQHARNPVDWHAWDQEAIDKARHEDKPILLSVGYAACHWCHVMEDESFENEATARLMNEHFVNIKVDREERPDLDQIYMNAVQMMTGHGGWPMTVFLTPDLVPFYGGTYFPPEDRYNMPGFPRVLLSVAEAYRTRPDEVRRSAGQMLAELRRVSAPAAAAGDAGQDALSFATLDAAYRGVARNYDRENGGFGDAPKFPAPMTLDLLLRTHRRTGDAEALRMVEHSCRRMAEGGIYDQLGGGFHRYSTDARWLVPHFEKMLYDNALLSRLYLHAHQATGDDFYRRIAEETLDYVVREMTSPEGGFYSTQDADSEGVEGKFFVWTADEVEEILGAEDARLFNAYYDVTVAGNFEGHNILHVTRPLAMVGAELGVAEESLRAALARSRTRLFEARGRRVKPARDEKILTAWNGLMLSSFAEAAVILGRADYREVAERNADFLLTKLWQGNLFRRSYKDGRARLNGYLDDYAYAAEGLLTLAATIGGARWLGAAQLIARRMVEEFWDEAEGGFFYTGRSHEELIVRSKDYFDNATPAGNSVAAYVLLRLAALTGEDDWRERAVAVFEQLRPQFERYPQAFGYLLGALDFHLSTPLEVALIGEDAEPLAAELWRHYLPNKVAARATEPEARESAAAFPLLRERGAVGGRATAYVCEHFACREPVTAPAQLSAQLADYAGVTSAPESG